MAYTDELARLLPRQYQAPRQIPIGDEEELDMFLPQSEIIGAQQQIAESGRGADRPYFIPSREELQQHGFQQLRKMLGLQAIQQAAEERKAILPRQVEGQYRLAGEQAKADAARSALEARERGASERVQTQQAGARERVEMQQRGGAQRTGLIQRMIGQRQKEEAARKQAAAIRGGKTPVPGGSGGIRGLFDMFIGPSGASREAAAQKAEQAGSTTADYDNLLNFAQQAQQENPGVSLDEALSLYGEQPSPEEYATLQQLWGQ